MNDLGGPLLVILLLLGCSAFFSSTEVAMFSLRRVDRANLARSGRAGDALILRLLGKPRRLIATLLIGNESVNVSISAVAAGLVGRLFPSFDEVELALLAVSFTLPLLLLFGEITPKTMAIKAPAAWARKAVRPLWLFGIVVTPLRLVVRGLADLIAWPLGGRTSSGPRDLSEAEFKALVDAGSAEGQVAAEERRLIHRVFEFGDKTVAEAMLPRDRVFALAYDLPIARLTQEVASRGFTRIPIYQKNLDNIRGVLHAKDLVVQGTGLSAPRRLAEFLHEPLFVPQTTRLDRLFRIFKQKKTHMALVVNEYGKLAGLVTMEDLLEQLFGELASELGTSKARSRDPRARAATPTPEQAIEPATHEEP